jgi:uncharacterized membrane protein
LLYDVLQAINNAKTDNKIKGISLEMDNINAGITQLDDIRNALNDFKKVENLYMLMGTPFLKVLITWGR